MDQVEAEAKRSPLGKLASYINEWVLGQPPPRSERARYERYVKRREEEKRRFSSHESVIGMGNRSGLPICALCGHEIGEHERSYVVGHRQKRFVHVSCYEEDREDRER
jgi:hypothetical protein